MKIHHLALPLFGLLAAVVTARGAVAVGDSDLIGSLQYSDNFNFGTGDTGTRNGEPYTAGTVLTGTTDEVENTYGNPSESYSGASLALGNDAHHYATTTYTYPGSSGAGSTDGIAEVEGNSDFGFAYNQGGNFIVQTDAVQTNDRIDLSIGTSVGIGSGISIFFRTPTNVGDFPSIGIYSPGVGEANTGVSNDVTSVGSWDNYAVDFNLNNDTLTFYANQTDLGSIDLTTFDDGKYLTYIADDQYVSIGGATNTGSDGIFFDNLQVGTPAVPEPQSWALSLVGLGMLAFLLRSRARARRE